MQWDPQILISTARHHMNYCIHPIDAPQAKYFKKSHYQFDYIEAEHFTDFTGSEGKEQVSVIGYMTLAEIDQDDSIDSIIIPHGLDDHYFKFHPITSERELKPKRICGYASVGADRYVAIYSSNTLPLHFLLFSISILLGICIGNLLLSYPHL